MAGYYSPPYGYGFGYGAAASFSGAWLPSGWTMSTIPYQPVPMGALTWGGTYAPYPVWSGFGGLGGLRRHGGSYSPQFAATGLPTDEEITEMVYDRLDVDMLIPYDADINVSTDAGEVTLTGTVLNKAIKHAAGDNAWWVPGVTDVHNELQVVGRHRIRARGRRGRSEE